MRTSTWFVHASNCVALFLSLTLFFAVGCGAKKDSTNNFQGAANSFPEWSPGETPPVGPACAAFAAPASSDPDGDGLCNAFDSQPSDSDANGNGVLDGLDPAQIAQGGGGDGGGGTFWDKASPLLRSLVILSGVGLSYNLILDEDCVDGTTSFTSCLMVDPKYNSLTVSFQTTSATGGVLDIKYDAEVDTDYFLAFGLNASTIPGVDTYTAEIHLRLDFTLITDSTTDVENYTLSTSAPDGGCMPGNSFRGAKITLDGKEECIDLGGALKASGDSDVPVGETIFLAYLPITQTPAPQQNQMVLTDVGAGGNLGILAVNYNRVGKATPGASPIAGTWKMTNEAILFVQENVEKVTVAMSEAAAGIEPVVVTTP